MKATTIDISSTYIALKWIEIPISTVLKFEVSCSPNFYQQDYLRKGIPLKYAAICVNHILKSNHSKVKLFKVKSNHFKLYLTKAYRFVQKILIFQWDLNSLLVV